MPLELYTGTKAVDTTEWSLTTDTSGPDAATTQAKVQTVLDVNDMVAGDTLQIRLYEKARAGDTQRLAQEWILTGAQASPCWISPEFTLMHGWDFTLDALAGTITVLWSIRSTVDTNVALIKAVTDLLPNAGALSSLATAAALDVVDNFLDTEMAAVLAAVDTEVAAIKAVTDLLPNAGALSSLATAAALDTVDNLLDTELGAVKTVVDAIKVVTDALPDAGALTGLATAANLATVAGYLDTEVASIKTETDKIAATITKVDAIQTETDKVPATITKVDAIKTKTDSITITVAGQVDANIESVNGTTVNGDGSATPWGP